MVESNEPGTGETGEETKAPTVYKMQREGFKVSKKEDGTKVINDFLTVGSKIGAGAYCKVYKA